MSTKGDALLFFIGLSISIVAFAIPLYLLGMIWGEPIVGTVLALSIILLVYILTGFWLLLLIGFVLMFG